VSAAMEGFMRGIPSIAISQEKKGDYTKSANLAAQIAEKILGGEAVLLNVNTPGDEFSEIRWTKLGIKQRAYDYKVVASYDPRTKPYFWIGGGRIKTLPEDSSSEFPTDCQAFLDEVASITPLQLDMTDMEMLGSTPNFFGSLKS